jgi:hypothetical protein
MSKKIYVTKTTYEKNANDGIEHFTDLNELANAVFNNELAGGRVLVFECVLLEHEVYQTQAAIALYNPLTRESS